MPHLNARKTSAEQSLLQELNAYRNSGCAICLNGRPVSPEKVVSECVREDRQYMRDYFITDSGQNIREINFIRLEEQGSERKENRRKNSSSFRR